MRWRVQSVGIEIALKILAKPTEDPHFVDARPSHIVTLNRADLLIESGADLEIGWLPPLIQSSRNKNVLLGRERAVPRIGRRAVARRAGGARSRRAATSTQRATRIF